MLFEIVYKSFYCIPVGHVPSTSMVILNGKCLPLGPGGVFLWVGGVCLWVWACLSLGLGERVSASGCRGNVWVNTPWAVTSTPLHAGIHTHPTLCMLEYTSPREQNHRHSGGSRRGTPSSCPPYGPKCPRFHAVFWKFLTKL